jgi:hypothetical protein
VLNQADLLGRGQFPERLDDQSCTHGATLRPAAFRVQSGKETRKRLYSLIHSASRNSNRSEHESDSFFAALNPPGPAFHSDEACAETQSEDLLHRVFYDPKPDEARVVIKAVGWKEHNTLFIRGREFVL